MIGVYEQNMEKMIRIFYEEAIVYLKRHVIHDKIEKEISGVPALSRGRSARRCSPDDREDSAGCVRQAGG